LHIKEEAENNNGAISEELNKC